MNHTDNETRKYNLDSNKDQTIAALCELVEILEENINAMRANEMELASRYEAILDKVSPYIA